MPAIFFGNASFSMSFNCQRKILIDLYNENMRPISVLLLILITKLYCVTLHRNINQDNMEHHNDKDERGIEEEKHINTIMNNNRPQFDLGKEV